MGELAAGWLAVALVGAAIKVTDAAADGEPGVRPAAAASWALLLAALAAAVRPSPAASLAVGAWVVGMLQPWPPAGRGLLWRWAEATLVAAVAAAALGIEEIAASGAALGAVQLLDHWVDGDLPPAAARGGVAWRAALFLLLAAGLWLDPLRLALVLSATPAAEQAGGWLARRSGLLERAGAGAGDSPDVLRWAG